MEITTTTSNYWTTTRVTFADGTFAEEEIPGPLSKGQRARRSYWGPKGKEIISKAKFAEMIAQAN